MRSGNQELITGIISSFARDNELLTKQLIDIQYWMRGAFQRDDIWQLTPYEREQYVEYLNNRFESAGEMMKKQVPVFI